MSILHDDTMSQMKKKRIAVIGSGISGLAAASLLNQHHDVILYEKNDYLGGHSRTVTVRTAAGDVPVDTGFIVFNRRNYPLLTRLFEYLQVSVAPSKMSFGVSINQGELEYSTRSLGGLFGQRKNAFNPQFLGMLRDILRFNRRALSFLDANPDMTLGACLDRLRLGAWFRDFFLLPMGGAIWSMPLQQMLDFPASTMIRFFHNHGLLSVYDQPQWYTVRGGSNEYVKRLAASLYHPARLGVGAKKILRDGAGVVVLTDKYEAEPFDEVVLACHANHALALLDQPTPDEQKLLSGFRYQANKMVLHSDTRFMPRNRQTWSSWVYLSEQRQDRQEGVSLSYWMNNLQPLSTDQPMIVTLNSQRQPDAALVHDEYWFEHPVFDAVAIRNQPNLHLIQGKNRVWFCGAYQRYGFHEDGLQSAVAVARQMGIEPPWL